MISLAPSFSHSKVEAVAAADVEDSLALEVQGPNRPVDLFLAIQVFAHPRRLDGLGQTNHMVEVLVDSYPLPNLVLVHIPSPNRGL
jgi:hypothetical protein